MIHTKDPATCQHIDYDDYFNQCNDCGAQDLLPEEEPSEDE